MKHNPFVSWGKRMFALWAIWVHFLWISTMELLNRERSLCLYLQHNFTKSMRIEMFLHATRAIKLYKFLSFFLSNNALHSSHRALWHMNESPSIHERRRRPPKIFMQRLSLRLNGENCVKSGETGERKSWRREKCFLYKITYFLPFIGFLIFLITSSWYFYDSFAFFFATEERVSEWEREMNEAAWENNKWLFPSFFFREGELKANVWRGGKLEVELNS